MKKIYTFLFMCFVMLSATAQRYMTPQFSSVDVQTSVTYGVNATVLYYSVLNEAVPEALVMDVYTPSGDTETNRPVILYFHTGNFLPFPQNQGTGGTRTDSTAVEICTRLAKLGYVVASCDYRLGWNPIAPTQEERVNTLINAAYRGVQDCRTAVRYFRKSVAESNNPFGIDPSRIAVWGQGTGGYITLAASGIDNYTDILLPKFTTSAGIPMVLDFVNGDIYGTSVGVNPLDGDTLCYPNHVGYSSDFTVAVNMGGACGDISWIDATDNPIVSFQVPTDPFAPYYTGTVIVPGLNLPVVEVSGSYEVQYALSQYGNNGVFQLAEGYIPGQPFTDA
ncbi:MAG: alpha/beta hydrolase, partial [Bacteroidota bacterium]